MTLNVMVVILQPNVKDVSKYSNGDILRMLI